MRQIRARSRAHYAACQDVVSDDVRMRAKLKHLSLEPDPATLSADPQEFSLWARLIVGPADGPGEESLGLPRVSLTLSGGDGQAA
jgi:hypothetical protein